MLAARPLGLTVAASGALAALLAGCTSGSSSPSTSGSPSQPSSVSVTATDTECTLSTATVAAGPTTFAVTNSGSKVTEVYVYGQDEGAYTKVMSEVENIGPGTSRDMTVALTGGTYEVACKPGQTGDGIRTQLTVTGGSASGSATATSATEVEIELSTDGKTISGPVAKGAKAGTDAEFEMTNNASSERTFEIKRPDGTVAGEVDIPAGAKADLHVTLSPAGSWMLIIEGGKKEIEQPFQVS